MAAHSHESVRVRTENGIRWEERDVVVTYDVPVPAQEGWGLGTLGTMGPTLRGESGLHDVSFNRHLVNLEHPLFATLRLTVDEIRALGENLVGYADNCRVKAERDAAA